MKTERISLVLSCMAAMLLAASVAFAQNEADNEETTTFLASAPPPVEVGRFQLFDGQYAVTSLKGPELAERHLFKIDTITGTVWVGKQIQYLDRKSGKVIQQRYWEPFEQYLEGQAAVPAGR